MGASEAGAGLQLSPNASRILIEWGLGPALARGAVAPRELVLRRWGEPRSYASMPFENAADGAPFWVTLRADLHEALADAARRGGVEILEGMSLMRMREAGEEWRLGFARADREVELGARCLIGADGHRSTARRLLGDARDLDPPRWAAWRTLLPAEKVPDFARSATTNLWLGRDGHAVHYPVAAGKLVNLVVIRRAAAHDDDWSRPGDPAELADIAGSAAAILRDLMALAPSWAVWTLRDRAPSPFLAKWTAALVGDAAHPVLPFMAQGAAMAVEDAAVLAAALPPPERFGRFEIEAGLSAYARARSRRVHAVFQAGRSNAFAYHLAGPLAWLRDKRIGKLGPDGMRQRYSWLYDWRMPAGGL